MPVAILVSVLIAVRSRSLFVTPFVLARQCETNSASAQPQMVGWLIRYIVRPGGTTLGGDKNASSVPEY